MSNGERYLEAHHIQAPGDEGPDTEDNVISLCTNDHSAEHFAAEREALAERMREIVGQAINATRRQVVRR